MIVRNTVIQASKISTGKLLNMRGETRKEKWRAVAFLLPHCLIDGSNSRLLIGLSNFYLFAELHSLKQIEITASVLKSK